MSIVYDPKDYEGWGTGIFCAGEDYVLVDHPQSVNDAVIGAEDQGWLTFTSAAGWEGDKELAEERNWLPRRTVRVRAKEVDIIDPLPPAYLAWYEDPERD